MLQFKRYEFSKICIFPVISENRKIWGGRNWVGPEPKRREIVAVAPSGGRGTSDGLRGPTGVGSEPQKDVI
jgi:hypothetical protein